MSYLPSVVAGIIAVLVGYSSSAVLVFEAARAAGATPEQMNSWIGVISLGIGTLSLGLSLYYRAPVMIAWSTAGSAFLITAVHGLPMSETVGSFVMCGALIFLFGVTKWFERVIDRIPIAIASALLAGVLFRFGISVFESMRTAFTLVITMFATYLVMKRFTPRYAVIAVLVLGVIVSRFLGLLHFENFHFDMTAPVFVMPEFTFKSFLGLSIPLFVIAMASQNVTGFAVMRANGYRTPISPLISWTGFATMVLGPFGTFTLNLAAITAAIAMGRESNEDPKKRYMAGVTSGGIYILLGIFSAAVVSLFAAFPKELVMALAGIALFSSIANGLNVAMKDETEREAALITFLVTASGLTLFDIGSAFWGVCAGVVSLLVISGGRGQRQLGPLGKS